MHDSSLLTVPANLHQEVTGYILNSGLSPASQQYVADLQRRLQARFGDLLWAPPGYALHITLMDWLAPLVDYGEDKDVLFRRLREKYAPVLQDILQGQSSIAITFDTLEVHPSAIIVKGQDDGSYQRIREEFLNRIELLPGTKQPPQIIHATICKFTAVLPLEEVQVAARELGPIHFIENIMSFRLVREEEVFMRKAEIVQQFTLKN